ncbi:hypothetical protein CHUAL_005152 [Chamberlinius hualienensis]
MIASQMNAIVVKVAALGLDPYQHLGKDISDLFPHFIKLNKKYGNNICGEGGEYETLTLDCPLFNKRLVIDEQEVVIHSNDAFAQVGYLLLKKLHLEPKPERLISPAERLEELGISTPTHFVLDLIFPYDCSTETTDSTCLELSQDNEETLNMPVNYSETLSSANGWFWISGLHASNNKPMSSAIECVLMELKELAKSQNFKMDDILLVQLFVKDMKDFAKLNSVYKTIFTRNPPTRVCVQTILPQNVSAVLSCTGFRSTSESTVVNHMHVQSVSHWAPANIGPYSQSVKLDGNLIYVSGQIGLVPGSMEIVSGGVASESALSLRHVRNVLAATSNGDMSNVLFGVCFLTNHRHINSVKHEWTKYRKSVFDGTQLPEIMNYVIVPALPRGALVEWQVSAIDQRPDNIDWVRLKGKTLNEMHVKTLVGKWTFADEMQGCMIATCFSVLVDDLNVSDAKLLGVLNFLCNVVESKEVVVSFQVYYKHSSISYTEMIDCQQKFNNRRAAFNFIPVYEFEASNCILLIVGHFV